jgi:hypothetical protein
MINQENQVELSLGNPSGRHPTIRRTLRLEARCVHHEKLRLRYC